MIARSQSGPHIILASESVARVRMLKAAGVSFSTKAAKLDETAIREALVAEGVFPRDISDALADAKARKIAEKESSALVIGSDQVLDIGGQALGKPESLEEARAQMRVLRGETHLLHSAAVVYHLGQPIWRHVGQVRLTMRDFDDSYLEAYLTRNWESIRESVGGYKLEEEGIRLFSRMDGDIFTGLGMPLLPLLNYLSERGFIES